jgi:hypothetical protein
MGDPSGRVRKESDAYTSRIRARIPNAGWLPGRRQGTRAGAMESRSRCESALDMRPMTRMRAYLVPLALSLWVGVASGKAPAPSFSREIQPILDSYCVQCHLVGAAQAGLVLEEGESYANLVGKPSTESKYARVVPGAPDKSYLLAKLQGTHLKLGGAGMGMPLVDGSQRPLDRASIELIKRWIKLGAKNN